MRLIEIIGPGCRRCDQAMKDSLAVVGRMGLDARVIHVTDPAEIATRGFLFDVPGIAIDGVVVSRGRVPSQREIQGWLTTEAVR